MYMNTPRKHPVFYSFHYVPRDVWIAEQIRNMGVVESNEPVSPNEWEEMRRKGERSIQRWISNQISTRFCVIVLIGHETATRRWVRYEIQRAWEIGKGLAGIKIHNLKDQDGNLAPEGTDPFPALGINARCYNPPAQIAYQYIRDNLKNIVENAMHEAGQRRY